MGVNEINFAGLNASNSLQNGLQLGYALGQRFRNNRLQDSDRAEAKSKEDMQKKIDRAARDAIIAKGIKDPVARNEFLSSRAATLEDPSDTNALISMPFDRQDTELDYVISKALPVSELASKAGLTGSAKVGAQKIYTNGTIVQSTNQGPVVFSPSGQQVIGDAAKKTLEEAEKAEIALAGGKAGARRKETLEADLELGGDVEENKEFRKLTGKARATAINEGSKRLTTIRSTVSNLKRGLDALNEGASSGVISNRLSPIVRASTVKLRDVQNALTLDVLNAATFGALSATELDLAQQTALPTDLPPTELRAHIKDKIAAQEKLADYFNEQIKFLNNGGTVAEFVTQKQDAYSAQNNPPTNGGNASTFTSKSGITFEVN